MRRRLEYDFPIDSKREPQLELVRGVTSTMLAATRGQVAGWYWESRSILTVTIDFQRTYRIFARRVGKYWGRMTILRPKTSEKGESHG